MKNKEKQMKTNKHNEKLLKTQKTNLLSVFCYYFLTFFFEDWCLFCRTLQALRKRRLVTEISVGRTHIEEYSTSKLFPPGLSQAAVQRCEKPDLFAELPDCLRFKHIFARILLCYCFRLAAAATTFLEEKTIFDSQI